MPFSRDEAGAAEPRRARRRCRGSRVFTEGGGDIAFKPTENGWGYNKTYANAWDRIFAKKGEEPASAPEPSPAAEPPLLDEKKLGLLTAALDGGALSERLFEEAKRELERDR